MLHDDVRDVTLMQDASNMIWHNRARAKPLRLCIAGVMVTYMYTPSLCQEVGVWRTRAPHNAIVTRHRRRARPTPCLCEPLSKARTALLRA